MGNRKSRRLFAIAGVSLLLTGGLGGYYFLRTEFEPEPQRAKAPALPATAGTRSNVASLVPTRFRRYPTIRSRQVFRREFARFLARAKLTREQEERFLDLVIGESHLVKERTAKIQAGEIKTVADWNAFMAPRKAEFEDQLRTLLGDELYRPYQTETMRIPLLRAMTIYAAIAARHDAPFTSDQIDLIVDATVEAFIARGAQPQLDTTQTLLPDGNYFVEVMNRKRAFADVLQDIGPALAPAQRTALQSYQDQQIKGWLAYRFGNRPPSTQPPSGG